MDTYDLKLLIIFNVSLQLTTDGHVTWYSNVLVQNLFDLK